MKIHKLLDNSESSDNYILTIAEDLLTEAKAGSIKNINVVYETKGKETVHHYTGLNTTSILGLLECSKFRILAKLFEDK